MDERIGGAGIARDIAGSRILIVAHLRTAARGRMNPGHGEFVEIIERARCVVEPNPVAVGIFRDSSVPIIVRGRRSAGSGGLNPSGGAGRQNPQILCGMIGASVGRSGIRAKAAEDKYLLIVAVVDRGMAAARRRRSF